MSSNGAARNYFPPFASFSMASLRPKLACPRSGRTTRRNSLEWFRMPYELVLLKNIHDPRVKELDRYIELGGYKTAERVVKEITPKDVIETTKATGLRGRGGAGFPTGLKWSFVPKDTGKPVYLCCNADESEPGTCKDRVIIERDPHQLIEGIIIASFAVDCHLAYICGEETGRIESLEGKRGQPRQKPPFPAVSGLYGCPTVVNNVETLANLPHLFNRGVDWFKSLGSNEKNTRRSFIVSAVT